MTGDRKGREKQREQGKGLNEKTNTAAATVEAATQEIAAVHLQDEIVDLLADLIVAEVLKTDGEGGNK